MRKRETWLDALRILSAFLVIVNHTNSALFKAHTPAQSEWWFSIAWYYVSKWAVPVFVMISGAVLLPKQDSLRKSFGRFLRILGVLFVFSYGYYLHDAWVNWGLWPRMIRLDLFVNLVWTQQITDGFWYLYFFMGLMLALPFLQRMASAMRRSDLLYLMGLCFGLDALWPLAVHYAPALALPEHLDVPMASGYIGLFFAGHWVRSQCRVTKAIRVGASAVLVASVAGSVALTYAEYISVASGEAYWFMDERTQPALLTVAGAVALMVLFKDAVKERRIWTELGGCAFGIYLVQDWLIAQTKMRLFFPLREAIPEVAAMLVWEAAVFAVCLGAAWIMKRIPGLKKLL